MIVEKGVPHRNEPPPQRHHDTNDGVPDTTASKVGGKAGKGIKKRRSAGLLDGDGICEDDDDEDDV
jgi:hypothetical protein